MGLAFCGYFLLFVGQLRIAPEPWFCLPLPEKTPTLGLAVPTRASSAVRGARFDDDGNASSGTQMTIRLVLYDTAAREGRIG